MMTYEQLKNLEFTVKREWPKDVALSQSTLQDFGMILRTEILILEKQGKLK